MKCIQSPDRRPAKTSRSILLLILSVTFWSACETVIDIDPPEYDSELSLISYFTPDSVWAAKISKTLPFGSLGDTTSAFPSNAMIMIYEGDVLVDRLTHVGGEDGWYVSSELHSPEPNTSYRIVAEAPGMSPIFATSVAPSRPVVSDVEITNANSSSGDKEYLINFRLVDPPGLSYYSFSIFAAYVEQDLIGYSEYSVYPVFMVHDTPQWYCSYSNVLNPISVVVDGEYTCTIGILSNRAQDEQILEFEIRARIPAGFNTIEDEGMILAVHKLSPEYMKYQGSLEDHDNTGEFGEPTNLFTNVAGGHGIFAGYSASYHFLDLELIE